jgi:hypothetical protein
MARVQNRSDRPNLAEGQIRQETRRQGFMAATLPWFKPMWFLFMGLFKVGGVQPFAKNIRWFES